MMKLSGYTLTLLFWIILKSAAGQGLPPGWDFIPTNSDHVISVRISSNPNINGVPLEAGDYIGVFYYDGDVQYCGGAAEWNGTSNIAVIAYGDDVTTPEKDGFIQGEAFNWRVFSWPTETEYEAIATYDPSYLQHDGTFYPSGFSALESLDADDLEVTVTIGDDSICEGATSQLFSTVTGASGIYSYNWTSSPPGFTSSDPDPSIQPAESTWYYLEATTYLTSGVDSVFIMVTPAAPWFLYLQNETVSDTATFTGNVIEAGQAVTDPPEGPFIISAGADVTFIGGDSVYLRDGFTAMDGSEFKAYIDVISCLQIPPSLPGTPVNEMTGEPAVLYGSEPASGQGVFIFPNPSEGLFHVRYYGPNTNDIKFQVVDLMGNSVTDKMTVNSPEFTVDLSHHPNGIYLIRLFYSNGITVKKMIKR
jgi:hypothetical protein